MESNIIKVDISASVGNFDSYLLTFKNSKDEDVEFKFDSETNEVNKIKVYRSAIYIQDTVLKVTKENDDSSCVYTLNKEDIKENTIFKWDVKETNKNYDLVIRFRFKDKLPDSEITVFDNSNSSQTVNEEGYYVRLTALSKGGNGGNGFKSNTQPPMMTRNRYKARGGSDECNWGSGGGSGCGVIIKNNSIFTITYTESSTPGLNIEYDGNAITLGNGSDGSVGDYSTPPAGGAEGNIDIGENIDMSEITEIASNKGENGKSNQCDPKSAPKGGKPEKSLEVDQEVYSYGYGGNGGVGEANSGVAGGGQPGVKAAILVEYLYPENT